MAKSQAVSTGEGVSRGEPFTAVGIIPTQNTPAEDTDVEYVPVGSTEWVHTPALTDQFNRPGLWKLGAPRAATFNLSDSDQLSAYNALLDKTHPEGSPRIILADKVDTKFFEGSFYALVHYRDILYKSVIKK